MNKLGLVLTGLMLGCPAIPAQMMPGGGNPVPDVQDAYMRMFQSAGNMGAMGSGMGVGMTEDLAVDSGGTAYVVRAVAAAQQNGMNGQNSNWQFELAAISPNDGSLQWKIRIPGGRVSHPRLAADGRIFVTVDSYQMFYANYVSGGQMMTGADASSNEGQLVVITHTDSSASIQAVIQTNSDVLSAPRLVAEPSTGSYMIYVVGYDMMSWTATPGKGMGSGTGAFAPGNKVLYAYRPDGTLKFSVQLGQGGMMP